MSGFEKVAHNYEKKLETNPYTQDKRDPEVAHANRGRFAGHAFGAEQGQARLATEDERESAVAGPEPERQGRTAPGA